MLESNSWPVGSRWLLVFHLKTSVIIIVESNHTIALFDFFKKGK